MSKILIVSTDWGHLSIARAVKETVQKKFDAELYFIKAERLSKTLNDFIYRFFPRLFENLFKVSETAFSQKLLALFADQTYSDQLRLKMHAFKPDVVINTYWGFRPSLEKFKDRFGYRFVNILADPWTFNKILISGKAENLTFDKYSWRRALSLSPGATVLPIGWFTEKKFFEIQGRTRESVRTELGLDPKRFTICVTGGSEGSFSTLKILRTFLNPKNDMQVSIMCGNNTNMYKAAKMIKSVSKKINGPTIAAIPYTHDMQKYMRAADLVIGKAGPNTLFESIATLTPFFAVSHFMGQEDGNLGIIRRYKIGYVEEKASSATKKLKEIIRNPKVLNKFSKNIEFLANYCQGSEEKLLNLLKP